jgi:hypothetical protein
VDKDKEQMSDTRFEDIEKIWEVVHDACNPRLPMSPRPLLTHVIFSFFWF